MRRIKIGNKFIGDGEPVFVIAEAGVNHNGDVELAKRMVDVALEAGVDAVKFQSYKTESIIIKSAPCAEYHKRSVRNNETWFDLLKRLEFTEKKQRELFDYCVKKKILFFSTPYDEASVDFLNILGVSVFKIASTDLSNLPLLEHVARYNKPIILSTGMSYLSEIKESVSFIVEKGSRDIILLQCTSNYPPSPGDANLNVIGTLRKEFGLLVGYSDHLACSQTAVAAVAKGASVYEVHFTLDRNLSGPDQKSSLEPLELKQIISDIRYTERLMGSYKKEVTVSENETRNKLRKSVAVLKDIKAGDRITRELIGVKRPGTGLAPKHLYNLLGKVAKRDIAKDELIQSQDLCEDSNPI